MRRKSVALAALLSGLGCSQQPPTKAPTNADLATGTWRAWLDCPGGELPFGLEIARQGDDYRASIRNGPETIPVPRIEIDGDQLILGLDHYDARLVARIGARGNELTGEWVRRSAGADSWSRLPFHARYGDAARFEPLDGPAARHPIDGRFRIEFESADDAAVGIFTTRPDGTVDGTFLTATGDYRYLAGSFEASRLRLSCFDGAHAFLFHAVMQQDGSLEGDFWSRDVWHETWTATRGDDVILADSFTLNRWNEDIDLSQLVYRQPDGNERSLADPEFAGRARIIELFGSWCPNCKDAARYLAELDERYRDRGLSIVGLAFEHTGDFELDARQVERYAAHNGVRFPLLIAGLSDKTKASEAFPALDRIRAYPTLIFLDGAGKVAGIHTGFSGPATGDENARMRLRIEQLLERLLDDTPVAG